MGRTALALLDSYEHRYYHWSVTRFLEEVALYVIGEVGFDVLKVNWVHAGCHIFHTFLHQKARF